MTKKLDAVERRNQLLQSGLELFATKGYHATKVSDIVKKSAVSQGTFYWYFSSKEEIALEILRDGQTKLLDVLQQGYRKEAGTLEDMIASSKRLITSLLQFSSENRDFMILLFLKGQGADKTIMDAITESKIAMEKAFIGNINRAIDLGMLENRHNVPLQAQMLTSLITGMISRWLFGPHQDLDYTPQQSIEELAEEIVHFEFLGLLGRRREI